MLNASESISLPRAIDQFSVGSGWAATPFSSAGYYADAAKHKKLTRPPLATPLRHVASLYVFLLNVEPPSTGWACTVGCVSLD